MKAGEKNYLKESNGTKANCNANVTQVRKSRIYKPCLSNFDNTAKEKNKFFKAQIASVNQGKVKIFQSNRFEI